MSFTHLHLHTEYSLLDGANRIQDLIPRLQALGMHSCAITDHGVMYGVIDFYRAMKAANLKPIIGCEVYVAPRGLSDKVAGIDNHPYHLVLLAKNLNGYKNLIKLVSIGFTEGFYYRPRIDFELLKKYHHDLICLSGCLSGELARTYHEKGYQEAKKVALAFQELFGEDYYLEVQANDIPEQLELNDALFRLSAETGIEPVATNDCHYPTKESAYAHEVLVCMQTGKKLKDTDRMQMDTDAFYIKSPEEMQTYFAKTPVAVSNTQVIAAKCNLEIPFGEMHLPRFIPPDGTSSQTYIKKVAEQGLRERLINKKTKIPEEQYFARLQHELEVIEKMGFIDYFLIVYDFVRFAHEKSIMVGPGRGSGGGSLVAYALKITNIDPLQFNLLFERFLNPERVSMPDFDMDFCYERRGEIIEYVTRKYGADHVCQIVTFGTLAARQSIRDVARVLDIPFAETSRIVKMIPNVLSITIDRALETSKELQDEYAQNAQTKEVIDLARQFEGMPRHASTHAAGVVIADVPITDVAPLSLNDEAVVVQFDKDIIESIGLIKMDFLGLRTLTVMRDTVELVEKNHQVKIDFETIPFDDKNVYQMLSDGDTAGVFQLESAGMTSFIKELKPETLEDIIAVISLYRPGPMEQIPKYVRSFHHPETISYDHPSLEPILNMTYGCIIYQEQVMQIVRDLAGFSMGQSDNVRRAMSKKKPEILSRYKNIFIHGGKDESGRYVEGAVANGVPEKIADRIFEEVEAFAGYAFNKSHATGYAVLAYQTAWLKYYYPVEFMAAMLNSFLGNLEKAANYIRVCKDAHIKVLPPDINKSQSRFSAEHNAIRFALGAIKNVGTKAISQVIEEREKNGPFKSFGDFIYRIIDLDINRKIIESLIKSSALDCFGVPRVQFMAVYEEFMNRVQRSGQQAMEGQLSLFDMSEEAPQKTVEPDYQPSLKEYSKSRLLAMEKEVLGVYVSGHPLDQYHEMIEQSVTLDSSKLQVGKTDVEQTDEVSMQNQLELEIEDQQKVIMAGIIVAKQELLTRNNDKMAFLTIEDLAGTFEVVVFPNLYQEVRFLLVENKVLLIRGHISFRDEENPNVLADNIIELKENEPLSREFITRQQNLRNNLGNKQKTVPLPPIEPVEENNYMAIPQSFGTVQVASQNQEIRNQPTEDLCLLIHINQDFTEADVRNLVAMLEYFSGDTPVRICLEQERQVETLQKADIDLQYLEFFTKRYGEENFIFV